MDKVIKNDINTRHIKPATVEALFSERLRKALGSNWKRLRNEHDMTIFEFCRRSGISLPVAADIESCRHSATSIDDCMKAAKVYGMTIESFLTEITGGLIPDGAVLFSEVKSTEHRDINTYGAEHPEHAAESGAAAGDEQNTDVDRMQLSRRTKRVVRRLGCRNTDDIAKAGRDIFIMTRGCGDKTIMEISEKMRKLGYEW